MLELAVGRLLELHERVVIEKGFFERGRAFLEQNTGQIRMEVKDYRKLRETIAEVEEIARKASLSSTQIAASRTRQALGQAGNSDRPDAFIGFDLEGCKNAFHHLLEIASRIRDDCAGRIYFQIEPNKRNLYFPKEPHFGEDVEHAFPIAIDDIAEAGKCMALAQGTATVFHPNYIRDKARVIRVESRGQAGRR